PESLYLLLTSVRGRERLRSVETVIVDEIHALVRDKRGSHLALTLERLAALCPKPLQRIGLSATQRPIEEIARFLVGASGERGASAPWCAAGHVGTDERNGDGSDGIEEWKNAGEPGTTRDEPVPTLLDSSTLPLPSSKQPCLDQKERQVGNLPHDDCTIIDV